MNGLLVPRLSLKQTLQAAKLYDYLVVFHYCDTLGWVELSHPHRPSPYGPNVRSNDVKYDNLYKAHQQFYYDQEGGAA